VRKNRLILKKDPLANSPIIYIRIKNNKVMYIGESRGLLTNRHIREEEGIGDFDVVIILKAPLNIRRRRYWEAYLITKLTPAKQITLRYRAFLHKANTGSAPVKDSEVYRKDIRPKTIEELDTLRKRTNMRGVLYWGDQLSMAKKHLKESKSCFSHFLECYKKDNITLKNVKTGD
jgi:hypothetical protein